ncbi:MAG: phosphate acyltransferase PlsX [Gammaproteobacteria bacterium]|jgi:phosphate acyltransferase|nr:phosphate acyltransferase PlsX [Gammaproteobacteria bacterium]MBT7523353.1 phosphate acyltransferase PlsX [Gammaproteobacteria bacterium]MBT7814408.1 phosphate acyltransferase PlsX [Gammaproteobacteria bacterium]
MMKETRIAVDAMGGDGGPEIIMPSVKDFLSENREVKIDVYGDEKILSKYLNLFDSDISRNLKIIHTDEKVLSEDSPSHALRHKKNSSMSMAIKSVKDKNAQACVSAGNTGALMAISRFILGTLDGIDRPAIESMLPSLNGHTHVLDLGANIDSKAEHLYQFAVMGSALSSVLDEKENPSVGLLNVGEETIKGNTQVKEAHDLLLTSKLNYVGFVEGDDIFCGNIDVIVCDGFVGNIALKTSEGTAKFISSKLKDEFKKNIFTKIAGILSMKVLNSFKKVADPRKYNGASLLGLKGIIVKSHGGADSFAFNNSLKIALKEVNKDVPSCIDKKLKEILG